MLNIMRRKAGSWFLKIIFILLILSFVVWGIADVFLSRSLGNNLAEVAGRPLTAAQLSQELRRLGRPLPEGPAADTYLREVLQQMVGTAALAAEAEALSLFVADSLVKEVLNQAFADVGGHFDRALLDHYAAVTGLSEEVILGQIRRDVAQNHLLGAFYGGAFLPSAFLDPLEALFRQRRAISMAYLPAGAERLAVKPTEEALRDFYTRYGDLLSTPPWRDFDVLILPYGKLLGAVRIDEADLRAAYEAEKPAAEDRWRYTFSQIMAPSEAAATAAAGLLKAGSTPQAAARQIKAPPPSLLKDIPASDLPDVFGTLRTMKPREARTVETALGWQVLYLEAAKPLVLPSFTARRPALYAQMRRKLGTGAIEKARTRMEDALGSGRRLRDVAREAGFDVLSFRHVEALQETAPAGLAAPLWPEVQAVLETLEEGQTSSIEAARHDDSLFGVDMLRKQPKTLPPFAAIHKQVQAAWTKDQKLTALRRRIASRLDVVNTTRMPLREAFQKPFVRRTVAYEETQNAADPLYGAFLQKAFETPAGRTFHMDGAEGSWVGVVDDLSYGKGKLPPEASRTRLFYGDLLQSYLESLQAFYGVRFNARALEAFRRR